MEARQHIFLTGATGLIGRYLLRNFLSQGCSVTALVRSKSRVSSIERIEKILDSMQLSGQLRNRLQVIEGEFPAFEPDRVDRRKMAACDSIVHSAASLSFHKDARGEPWLTNVAGTECLLKLAGQLGLTRWVQISTAYVCGQQQGVVHEEPHRNSEPTNQYEASKQKSEELVCSQPNLNWTILRPGVVVGDSETGYTSTYQGIYRCLQSIAFLSKRIQPDTNGSLNMPLRFMVSGNEQTNLVPVDWVAEAITRLYFQPAAFGKYFHLTARNPVPIKVLVNAVQEFYGLRGIEFIGDGVTTLQNRNIYERVFERETKQLRPYFQNDPVFNRTFLDMFLPKLKEKTIDHDFIQKLLTFAEADNWGKSSRQTSNPSRRIAPQEFFEVYFPQAASRSQLARIHDLNAIIGFEVTGNEGGHWVCELAQGNVVSIKPVNALPEHVDFRYQTDSSTLEDIVLNQLSARDAFFKQRIHIKGNIERALLLSMLLEDLLQEIPYQSKLPTTTTLEKSCA